jgi:hypothetical protein
MMVGKLFRESTARSTLGCCIVINVRFTCNFQHLNIVAGIVHELGGAELQLLPSRLATRFHTPPLIIMSKRNREMVADPEFIDLTGEDADEDRDGSTAATVALPATQHQQQGSNRSEAARAKRARMQLIRATAARVGAAEARTPC